MELPKYAVAAGRGELRERLLSLPDFQTAVLLKPAASNGSSDSSSSSSSSNLEELWRAYLLLSFLAHVRHACSSGCMLFPSGYSAVHMASSGQLTLSSSVAPCKKGTCCSSCKT